MTALITVHPKLAVQLVLQMLKVLLGIFRELIRFREEVKGRRMPMELRQVWWYLRKKITCKEIERQEEVEKGVEVNVGVEEDVGLGLGGVVALAGVSRSGKLLEDTSHDRKLSRSQCNPIMSEKEFFDSLLQNRTRLSLNAVAMKMKAEKRVKKPVLQGVFF